MNRFRTPVRLLRRILVGMVGLAVATVTVQWAAGPVTHSGFDREGRMLVRSAVARFEAARLDLPLVHVRHADFGDRCQPRGQARDSWPIKVARICAVAEEVIVHELAHTWAFVHLTEESRHQFALRRGTPTWRSREHPWMDRASEHAADILTWYLYWSEQDTPAARIAGDVSVEAYMSDLSWLMATADLAAATEMLASRAGELAPMWVATASQ